MATAPAKAATAAAAFKTHGGDSRNFAQSRAHGGEHTQVQIALAPAAAALAHFAKIGEPGQICHAFYEGPLFTTTRMRYGVENKAPDYYFANILPRNGFLLPAPFSYQAISNSKL